MPGILRFARRLLNRYSPMCVCVANACNLRNGNMSEYPTAHPLPDVFHFPRCYEFPVFSSYYFFLIFFITCLFIYFAVTKMDGGLVKKNKMKPKLTGCYACRSARDCGATERRCRSFGRNRRVLLPGPRRTDASTLVAQKRTKGE